MQLGELDLADAAKEAAGNWQEFRCFVWWRERDIEDSENWAIIYTSNRDSGLLDQSKRFIRKVNGQTTADYTEPDNPERPTAHKV